MIFLGFLVDRDAGEDREAFAFAEDGEEVGLVLLEAGCLEVLLLLDLYAGKFLSLLELLLVIHRGLLLGVLFLVQELTTNSIRAIHMFVELFAKAGLVILREVLLALQLILSVRKRALRTIRINKILRSL